MSKRSKTLFTSWSMPDPAKNYVPLPKGIYRIDLSAEEIAIYGYLFSLENENFQSFSFFSFAAYQSSNMVWSCGAR